MSTANFWDHHGIFFLIFITLFPRLTLFFSNVAFGGIFWWIGFFFAPRFLAAILATLNYMHSNPILVAISWIVAISGETGEKRALKNRIKIVRFGGGSTAPPPMRDVTAIHDDKVVDADYKRLE